MLTLDTSRLEHAIRFSVNEVGRDLPDVLNRGGRNVAIKAIRKTPKASAAKIAAVTDAQLAARIATAARRKGVKIPKGAMPKLIKNARARMRSARGYTAGPGWTPAAKAFGGKGVRLQPGFERSEARRGSGSKASVGRLIAELVNTAPAAEKIGTEALQEVVDAVALDLVTYGYKKLDKTFKKVSF